MLDTVTFPFSVLLREFQSLFFNSKKAQVQSPKALKFKVPVSNSLLGLAQPKPFPFPSGSAQFGPCHPLPRWNAQDAAGTCSRLRRPAHAEPRRLTTQRLRTVPHLHLCAPAPPSFPPRATGPHPSLLPCRPWPLCRHQASPTVIFSSWWL